MGVFRKVAIVSLSLSVVVFVALFGRLPAFRHVTNAINTRAAFVRFPNFLLNLDRRTTNGRVSTSVAHWAHYLLYEQNPAVLIFFLSILTASALLFLSAAWPALSNTHRLLVVVLLPAPYLFTYLCCTSTASYITPANIDEHLALYPYDYTLFFPNIKCRTCNFDKPARSKHCSLCKTCMARADHHCAWVNNCVGRANYKWFLLLMLSLVALLSYGANLALVVLEPRVPGASAWHGRHGFFGLIERWGHAFGNDARVGGVGLLASLTAPLALGLLGYHVYLIWLGATTNETAKWGGIREGIEDELVWKGSRDVVLSEYADQSNVNWPIQSKQVVVTTSDGQVPRLKGMERRVDMLGGDGGWRKVGSLDDVINIYDIGFRRNLSEIFAI